MADANEGAFIALMANAMEKEQEKEDDPSTKFVKEVLAGIQGQLQRNHSLPQNLRYLMLVDKLLWIIGTTKLFARQHLLEEGDPTSSEIVSQGIGLLESELTSLYDHLSQGAADDVVQHRHKRKRTDADEQQSS